MEAIPNDPDSTKSDRINLSSISIYTLLNTLRFHSEIPDNVVSWSLEEVAGAVLEIEPRDPDSADGVTPTTRDPMADRRDRLRDKMHRNDDKNS